MRQPATVKAAGASNAERNAGRESGMNGTNGKESPMKWFLFPIAVVATSLLVVAALVAIFALPARIAFASALGSGTPWNGGPWSHGAGFELPAQLQNLRDVPPDQRFSHFAGAQINLKDKDNKPITISITPGTV